MTYDLNESIKFPKKRIYPIQTQLEIYFFLKVKVISTPDDL